MKRTLGVLLVVATGQAHAAPAQAEYAVRWRADAFPKAEVTARLRSATCTFKTHERWATFFDNDRRGWSRFVTDLRAFRGGKPLAVKAADNAWIVGDGKPCDVELRYTVDFSFGKQAWPAGNEQVAFTDDKAVYTTGLPLFVLGDEMPARVRFDVPAGWTVSTPWSGIVRNREALIGNTIVVGQHAAATFKAQQLAVNVAMLGDYASSKDAMVGVFTKVVPALTDLFGDREPGTYMFVVLPGPEDGESFEDSFAVTTASAPTERNQIVWSNHLAHELVHYWMGHKLAPSDAERDDLQWFTEGVTEYLANTALLSTKVYDDAQYRDRMGRHLGAYVMTRSNPNFKDVTPKASGARKWQNRPLVYSGGASIGFCLDAAIRTASKGKRSLRDVTRGLFARRAKERALSAASIRTEASAAAGSDLSAFFTKYVDGTETLPIAECATQLGLRALVQNHDVFLLRD